MLVMDTNNGALAVKLILVRSESLTRSHIRILQTNAIFSVRNIMHPYFSSTDSSKTPQYFTSWVSNHHDQTYGGFVDAVCDKVFVVSCWIFLVSTVKSSGFMAIAEYVTLWCLICTETASGCIRFRAFYSGSGVAPLITKGFDFSSSVVKVSCHYLQ